MPLTVKQFGGGEGSYAGDCALILADDWACLVDLGRAGSRQNEVPVSEVLSLAKLRAKLDLNVVITHFHADHMANQQSWSKLREARLFHFDSQKPEVMKTVAGYFKEAVKIDCWREIEGKTAGLVSAVQGESPRGLSYRMTIIPPEADHDKLDENDMSMGVLLEVGYQRAQKLTFLSLGDMTPKSASLSVEDCLRTYGFYEGRPLDLIKLAHHGSENNLLPLLWDVIKPGHTRLIISGYTMTDTGKLCKLLEQTRPLSCTVLFEDQSSAEKFKITAALKKVLVAGAKLAKDYVVTIGDTGDVSWPG